MRTNSRILSTLAVAVALLLSSIPSHAAIGDLFVGNFSGTISQITPGGSVTTFATGLTSATDIAFDTSHNLFVGDQSGNAIIRISPLGTVSTYWQGGGLGAPDAIAIDSSGNLFIGESAFGRIDEITPGGIFSTFSTGFNPYAMVFDSTGNMFEADGASGKVNKITPGGVVTVFASGLTQVSGIAIDSSGNLFVDDGNNIDKITPGGVVSLFASGFNLPMRLAFDSAGNLYEANGGTNTINKITPGGTVTLFASGLNFPVGLAFAVPEPSTDALLASALALLAAIAIRKKVNAS